MGSFEAVIVTAIFLVPGFMIIELDDRLFPRSKENDFEIEKIVNALILSVTSALVSIAIVYMLNMLNIENIKSIKDLARQIGNFDFIFKYIVIVIFSIAITEIIYICYRKLILYLINKIHKAKKETTVELKSKSVWEYITNIVVENPDKYCVEIIKNGNVLSRGYLDCYSPTGAKKKELTLVATNNFDDYFEADKNKESNKRLFKEIEFEYYDIDNDVLLKFYNLDKLNAYFDELEESK